LHLLGSLLILFISPSEMHWHNTAEVSLICHRSGRS
jgi:hypothetical protein